MYREESSMFEAQDWQDAFQRIANLQSDPDRRLWWRFFGIACFLPGILKNLRRLVGDLPHQPEYSSRGSAILERAKGVYKAMHNEHVIYQHTAPHPRSLFGLPSSAESSDRTRLRVFFFYTIIYICRVLATLAPSEIERATSEVEAQEFANRALHVKEVTTELDPAMAWHLQQRNDLARSIIDTQEEWFSDNEHGTPWVELQSFLAKRWLKWEDSWRARVLAKELGVS